MNWPKPLPPNKIKPNWPIPSLNHNNGHTPRPHAPKPTTSWTLAVNLAPPLLLLLPNKNSLTTIISILSLLLLLLHPAPPPRKKCCCCLKTSLKLHSFSARSRSFLPGFPPKLAAVKKPWSLKYYLVLLLPLTHHHQQQQQLMIILNFQSLKLKNAYFAW